MHGESRQARAPPYWNFLQSWNFLPCTSRPLWPHRSRWHRSARYAGPEASDEQNLDLLLRELERAGDRRVAYVCGLAYVADGRSDGYAEVHMNAWDCLAGLLLVAEAGGRVGPFLSLGSLTAGGPVIAAAPGIAEGFAEATGLALEA